MVFQLLPMLSLQPFNVDIFEKNMVAKELRKNVINYIEDVLSKPKDRGYIPRDDYLEMLQLCLIILGSTIPGYTFKLPGACHNARWMAPIIYSIKIYLFRDQLLLSPEVTEKLEDFCLFACLVYTIPWIQCCVPSNAAVNDLAFLNQLRQYSEINDNISKEAIGKFEKHLWYLGSELIVLSLFSSKVSSDSKRCVFENMKKIDNGEWIERNRRLTDLTNLNRKNLHDFVGTSSMSCLKSLNVDINFMFDEDPRDWSNLANYKKAKNIVDSIKVVNDTAERTLNLMSDFNGTITNNEVQKQNVIQVVEDHRKRVKTSNKSVLSSYKRR